MKRVTSWWENFRKFKSWSWSNQKANAIVRTCSCTCWIRWNFKLKQN